MATFDKRDIRASAQDPKRAKERDSKWSRGSRPLAGTKINVFNPSPADTRVRPQRALPENRARNHNIAKAKIPWDIPRSHSRAKVDPMEELNDASLTRSIIDLLPSPTGRDGPKTATNTADPFLYSFDRVDSPGQKLSLDVFVKSDVKATEKLVEREYEVLDNDGQTLTGRKARRNLRGPSPRQRASEPTVQDVDDDGFELVKAEC
ncbi:uncharacterized protein PG998_003676 [Apiospora kogelbergensis]|uniref:uncharacterized protein n=1 Tax=Apiospora kogelbergensis TaxID=1337665 RepID=UPI00312D4E2D